MMYLAHIRDLIATLGIADDDRVYSGKLDNKQEMSIGIYNRVSSLTPIKAIGDKSSYNIKRISILVHWNRYQRQAEDVAIRLYEKLEDIKDVTINDHRILFVLPQTDIQDVGTDEGGIYEYVLWFDFYYERSN